MIETTEFICSSTTPTAVGTKALGLSQAAQLWLSGEDVGDRTVERPTKPYAQNEWVFICINEIIKACRSIQLMLSTGDDQVVEAGPAYDLLFRNGQYSWTNFLTETVGFFSLYRLVYWVFPDVKVRTPTSILVVGPEQLKPVIKNGVLLAYKLQTGPGRTDTLPLDQVYPVSDFNPYSSHSGLGPTTVGKLPISSSYQAALYNESLLANGAKLGAAIIYPGNIQEDEKRTLRSQFENRHAGARNAGRTVVLSGNADIKTFGQSMVELDMINLRNFDAKTICSLFNVPPEIVGLSSEAQYAHGPAQQRFIANTVTSLLAFLADHLTHGVLSRFTAQPQTVSLKESRSFAGTHLPLHRRRSFRQAGMKALQSDHGLFAWFAIDDHPTMQAAKREMADKAAIYAKNGVPMNQLIQAYDLPFEETPWGNEWWVSAGLIPARFTLDAGVEGIGGPSLPEGDGGDGEPEEEEDDATGKGVDPLRAKEIDPDHKLWRRWIASWSALEKEYTAALRTFFLRQQRVLITKLKQALSDKTIKADTSDVIARVVFDLKVENNKLKVINNTFFEKGAELGIRQGLTETAGLAGDALTEAAETVMQKPLVKGRRIVSNTKITGVNKTTQRIINNTLRTGIEKGEPLNDLADRIADALGGNRKRALSIARTETSGAVSTGRHAGFQEAKVDGKGWVTSGDDHVRDSHQKAGRDYSTPIPLNTPFVVGREQLMFPGDPNGSPGEIINCRCLEIALAMSDRDGSLVRYQTITFYSYSDMVAA